MSSKETLTIRTPDKHGFTPDAFTVGLRMRHTGNGKVYVIVDFAWLGDTDEWGYLHRAEGEHGALVCRPLSHMAGVRSNGEPRYERL